MDDKIDDNHDHAGDQDSEETHTDPVVQNDSPPSVTPETEDVRTLQDVPLCCAETSSTSQFPNLETKDSNVNRTTGISASTVKTSLEHTDSHTAGQEKGVCSKKTNTTFEESAETDTDFSPLDSSGQRQGDDTAAYQPDLDIEQCETAESLQDDTDKTTDRTSSSFYTVGALLNCGQNNKSTQTDQIDDKDLAPVLKFETVQDSLDHRISEGNCLSIHRTDRSVQSDTTCIYISARPVLNTQKGNHESTSFTEQLSTQSSFCMLEAEPETLSLQSCPAKDDVDANSVELHNVASKDDGHGTEVNDKSCEENDPERSPDEKQYLLQSESSGNGQMPNLSKLSCGLLCQSKNKRHEVSGGHDAMSDDGHDANSSKASPQSSDSRRTASVVDSVSHDVSWRKECSQRKYHKDGSQKEGHKAAKSDKAAGPHDGNLTRQQPASLNRGSKHTETNKVEVDLSGVVRMPLPRDILQHIQSNPEQLNDKFSSKKVSFEVKQDILEVRADGHDCQETQKKLNGLLAQLHQRQVKVDHQTGLYLQSCQDKKSLEAVTHNCVSAHVHFPQNEVLLRATSDHGHTILVHKGNITAAGGDTDVIVLPLWEGKPSSSVRCYEAWPVMYKKVLNAALLSCEAKAYADDLKPPDSFTLTLKSPRLSSCQYIVVMHVDSSDKFKDYLNAALNEAVQSAVSFPQDSQQLCIALPLIVSDRDKDWKTVLPAVVDALKKLQTNTTVTLKLYAGSNHVTLSEERNARLVQEMVNYFKTYTSWTCPATSLPCMKETRIKLVVGDILGQEMLDKTDVMVNSTDKFLEHTHGRVSKALLEKAGHKLRAECQKEYPKPLRGECLVAVTNSFDLKSVKKIFHVVLPPCTWKDKENNEHLLEELRNRVHCCLTLASAHKYKSITFPTLGTGKLKYPADSVAETMFSAARDFFVDMPHSSLHTVYIVCFPEDRPLIQRFKAVEAFFKSAPGRKENLSPAETSVQNATVHLYGAKNDVEEAVEKVRKIEPPAEHVASKFATDVDSSVDLKGRRTQKGIEERIEEAIEAKPEELSLESDNQALCSLSIPLSVLHTEGFQEKLCDSKIMKIQNEEGNAPRKHIWFKPEHFDDVSATIKEFICLSDHQVRSSPHQIQSTASRKEGKDREEKWSKVIEHQEYLALSALMGEEFVKMFTVNEQISDKREIKYHGSSPPQEMLNKMNSLRKEELQVSKEEVSKLGEPFDTKHEGVDAFIYPDLYQGKVLIFSFEYTTLAKARHVVNVKLGNVKVTSRGKRRFAGENPESRRNQTGQFPSNSMGHTSTNAGTCPRMIWADRFTKSGIRVSAYKSDITKLPVDAIVNAANEHLSHGGGVAYAIARAAGFELENEGADYIKGHGTLKVTDVAVTTGGLLSCKKVLHAVGPRWDDYTDKSVCRRHLSETVFNCLKTSHECGFKTLAVSSVSSAIFGVPQHICAECYLSAVQKFDKEYGGHTSLCHVHFVDVNDTMVSIIQDTFTQKWDTCMLSVNPQPPPSDSVSGTDMLATKRCDMWASRQYSDPGNIPVSAQTSSQSKTTENTEKIYLADKHGEADCARQQPGNTEPLPESFKNCAGAHVQKAPEVPDVSAPGIETVAGESDIVKRFIIGGLHLIFQRKNISSMDVESITLWQPCQGDFFEDLDSKQIIDRNGAHFARQIIPRLKKTLKNNSFVSDWYGYQLLISCCILPSDVQDMTKICRYIEKVFNAASREHIKTLAIAAFPQMKGADVASRQDIYNFAAALHKVISEHSTLPSRTIGQVYIVTSDTEYLKAISDDFDCCCAVDLSQKAAVQRSSSSLQSSASVCGFCQFKVDILGTMPSCGHTICKSCHDRCLKTTRACPECQVSFKAIRGSQPKDGKMKMYRKKFCLPGYPECDTLVIEYCFSSEKQRKEDPQPGCSYKGYKKEAFLPNNTKGRKVLMLLKVAFDRGLIFSVAKLSNSDTVGIVWNDILHKTEHTPYAQSRYSYPDYDYLQYVQDKLRAHGVSDQDFTPTQKDFVDNPERYLPMMQISDFSGKFNRTEIRQSRHTFL